MSEPNTITINEVRYVRADSLAEPVTGDRVLVFLPSGFIFAGNISEGPDGRWRLRNAVNVRKWSQGGIGGLSKSSKESGATLDPCGDVLFAKDKPLHMVPIHADW